jgi:hypothetical protein
MENGLSREQLTTIVSTIAGVLDSLEIPYAIMGGAAVCLIANDPSRQTKDIDLVIQVDGRSITADTLTHHLLVSFPDHFGPIDQFGHVIPGYKLTLPEGTLHLVDLEVFDRQSWPQRPQYDLQATTVMTMHINERQVKVFNPAWLLREKILTWYGRQGSPKEETDIIDLMSLVIFVSWGQPELNFDNGPLKNDLEEALRSLLQKYSDLRQPLRQKIKCTAVFSNW